jgi:hypothetical protein
MFCAPGLVFDSTEGVGSRFHVLRSQTRCRRCRVRRVPFSCFVLHDSISTVPCASGPIFMFCAPGLVVGSDECVGSPFHILRARTRFRRYRGRRVLFLILRSRTCFHRYRGRLVPFSYFGAPCLVLGGTEGVWFRFHILRTLTCFRWYRGRQVPFLCFALPNSLSALPSASGPVVMFCAPGLVFGDAECVGSYFHDLRAHTRFRPF